MTQKLRSRRQIAADLRREFRPDAARLATALTGRHVDPYRCSQQITRLASMFSTPEELVAVVAPGQGPAAHGAALAHGLTHQGDRLLSIVVPDGSERHTAQRLASIQGPVRLVTYSRDHELAVTPVPSRAEVTADYARLVGGSTAAQVLREEHAAWIEDVLRLSCLLGAAESARTGGVTYRVAGSNLLRLRSGPSLRLEAGLASKHRLAGAPEVVKVDLTAPPTPKQLARIEKVLAHDAVAVTTTTAAAEHRWQHALGAAGPETVGLTEWKREHPAARGAGMNGFIDFLGIDRRGELHVVETKIGGDDQIVLQVLDYVAWVSAHEDRIRARWGWPAKKTGSRVHVDLLLATKIRNGRATGNAVDQYLAGQLEAVRGDLPVTVRIADDVEASPLLLRTVPRQDLFVPGAHITAALHGPRWAGRVQRALDGRGRR